MNLFDINILIVDDSKPMRLSIRYQLRKLGFKNIIEAENGNIALQLLEKNIPNLMLLDWNMPGISGIEVVKIMKNDLRLKNIPVIMVTAEAQKTNILAAIEAGANNYIVKPFTDATLYNKITVVMKNFNITA